MYIILLYVHKYMEHLSNYTYKVLLNQVHADQRWLCLVPLVYDVCACVSNPKASNNYLYEMNS